MKNLWNKLVLSFKINKTYYIGSLSIIGGIVEVLFANNQVTFICGLITISFGCLGVLSKLIFKNENK